MRNDSILYSGSSSSSFGSNKEQNVRKEKREKREDEKNKLTPASEIIFNEIEAEMASTMFILNIDIEGAIDEKMFMIEMMARQKYIYYLKQLQTKLNIVLREKKL